MGEGKGKEKQGGRLEREKGAGRGREKETEGGGSQEGQLAPKSRPLHMAKIVNRCIIRFVKQFAFLL